MYGYAEALLGKLAARVRKSGLAKCQRLFLLMSLVFGALGVVVEAARFFGNGFEENSSKANVARFTNPPNNQMIKRTATPRVARTTAEH